MRGVSGVPMAICICLSNRDSAAKRWASWRRAVGTMRYPVNRIGAGEVSYLKLGGCRVHYDTPPTTHHLPHAERGGMGLPVLRELLRRGVAYCGALAPA